MIMIKVLGDKHEILIRTNWVNNYARVGFELPKRVGTGGKNIQYLATVKIEQVNRIAN